jgi:hypothetical protein
MAFTFRSAATNAGGVVVCNRPSGTANGDLLIGSVDNNSATTTITWPSGWTPITPNTQGDLDTSQMGWKIASGEPTSWTWSFSPAGSYREFAVLAFSAGVDAASPQDAHSATMTTPSTASPICPSIETGRDGNLVVASIVDPDGGYLTPTQPTSMSLVVDNDSCHAIAWIEQASAGATGTKTWTLTGGGAPSSHWHAHTTSFNAPSAGGAPFESMDPGTQSALVAMMR